MRCAPVWLLLMALPLLAQEKPIDTQRSVITIYAAKTGLLSVAAHDHTIEAPVASGTLEESGAAHVQFTVETAKMLVRFDPRVSAQDQDTIQKDMEEKTLDVKRFPEITFRSTHAGRLAGGDWKVDGELSLHGVTKPVSLTVKHIGEAYTGHTFLKQTDFGIKPISVGGGTIRVKNELRVEFQIFPGK